LEEEECKKLRRGKKKEGEEDERIKKVLYLKIRPHP